MINRIINKINFALLRDKKGGGSFTVLMTSLSVIMLAFFILLNSIAVIDSNRVRQALGSLIGAFRILPGGYTAVKGTGKELSLPSIPLTDANSFMASVLSNFERMVYKKGLGDEVGVINSEKGLTFTLSSKVLFEVGTAEIKEPGKGLLRDIAQIVRKTSSRIQVEGHTDSVPIHTDRYASNWELSLDRAVHALQYLTEEEGIDPERFSLGGYADSKPLFTDEKKAAQNRRIEVTLLNRE